MKYIWRSGILAQHTVSPRWVAGFMPRLHCLTEKSPYYLSDKNWIFWRTMLPVFQPIVSFTMMVEHPGVTEISHYMFQLL